LLKHLPRPSFGGFESYQHPHPDAAVKDSEEVFVVFDDNRYVDTATIARKNKAYILASSHDLLVIPGLKIICLYVHTIAPYRHENGLRVSGYL
jgi:hypothetical protein